MMDISRNNYEACLLDLIEGRLNAEDTRRVRDFLLLNPDCAERLEEAQPWILEPESVPFPGKMQLKKELPDPASVLSDTNFGLFSIARLEGDLTHEQAADHSKMVKRDKDKQQEWFAWNRTKLTGTPVPYKRKDQLKKETKRNLKGFWISVVSSAAAIALVITLFRLEPVMRNRDVASDSARNQEVTMDNGVGLEEEITAPPSLEPAPMILADEPVILSIKKHQDPPELTGNDKDSAGQEVIERTIQERPLRIAMMAKHNMQIPEKGEYDRITPLDLPPAYPTSYTLTWASFSENGLRQTYKEFVREKDLSFLTIASAGINGINRMAGSDLSLNVSRDREGKVSGFRLNSNRFSVSAPIEKSE